MTTQSNEKVARVAEAGSKCKRLDPTNEDRIETSHVPVLVSFSFSLEYTSVTRYVYSRAGVHELHKGTRKIEVSVRLQIQLHSNH